MDGLFVVQKNAFYLRMLPNWRYITSMSIAEVRSLPLREKLQILEVIWADLNERVDKMSVSPAVGDLLDERIERVRDGSTEVHDWDSVKFSIGRQ